MCRSPGSTFPSDQTSKYSGGVHTESNVFVHIFSLVKAPVEEEGFRKDGGGNYSRISGR